MKKLKCTEQPSTLGKVELTFTNMLNVKLSWPLVCQTLTYSPIAAMWNCYLDVCLHDGLVHRRNGVIICTI